MRGTPEPIPMRLSRNRIVQALLLAGGAWAAWALVLGRSPNWLSDTLLKERRARASVAATADALRAKGVVGYRAPDGRPWDRLSLAALKQERRVEAWGVQGDAAPQKIAEWPFTGFSGTLGPKLREGDRQIPEGVYEVEYLNPRSSYHLSVKLNYPNAFERRMAHAEGRDQPGSDIFFHGGNATVGCIPIGDDGIEELFLAVAEVGEKNVCIIIAPCDLRVRPRPRIPTAPGWIERVYDEIDAALAPLTGRREPVVGPD